MHQVARSIISINENRIFLVGFDRHFYEYNLIEGNWEFIKDFTSEQEQSSIKESKEESSDKSEVKPVSIFEKMKMFDQSHQSKKASILVSNERKIVGSETLNSIHNAAVVSYSINSSKLITSDLAGFIKEWSL